MALNTTACYKNQTFTRLECHCYHYLLLKNQFTDTLLLADSIIAEIFHYGRDILPTEGIKFWNWGRLSRKCALANQESINTSIAKKCGYIMWNQQLFHRFSFGYS